MGPTINIRLLKFIFQTIDLKVVHFEHTIEEDEKMFNIYESHQIMIRSVMVCGALICSVPLGQ